MSAKPLPQKTVWTVVAVNSGVPNTVETFNESASARRRASYLRRNADPNDDVVAVFSSTLKTSARRNHVADSRSHNRH
jgi:hypothetical protein